MFYMLEWHKIHEKNIYKLLQTQRHVEEEINLSSTHISHYPSMFPLLPLELWPLESDEEH